MNRGFLFVIMCLLHHLASGQDFQVLGANPAWEGSTETYRLKKADYNSLPSGISSISFVITNGVIVAQQTVPYIQNSPVFVTVKWDCLATGGNIAVLAIANGQSFSYSYAVTLLSSSNYPEMCTDITPEEQNVSYNQIPEIITVPNCSPFCQTSYSFNYQWQVANLDEEQVVDIPESYWSDITVDGNSETYQAPSLTSYGGFAYRRRTTYLDDLSGNPQPLVVKFSKVAVVRFTKRLDPGSISANTQSYSSYNNVPIFVSVPASGGLCEEANYQYTWEATNSAGVWEVIGNTETFPLNAEPISYTRSYRRSVQCGADVKYTNVVTIYFEYISVNTENRNYVRSVEVKVPGLMTWNEVDGAISIGEKFQNTTYLDGLGRPIQAISKGTGTPSPGLEQWKDDVQIYEYDELGRVSKNYLPYSTYSNLGKFKESAENDQAYYYSRKYPGEVNTAFSIVTYENSPLNRQLNKRLPGNSWLRGHGVSTSFENIHNKEAEKIPIIVVGYDANDVPKTWGFYADATLRRVKAIDENESVVITYTNFSGQVILKKVQIGTDADEYKLDNKWACTYYVYDDFGRLRFTLEPSAVSYFVENDWNFGPNDARVVLDGLCFKYLYDTRGNMIIKKTPGNEELRMAYDKRNRLILSQDGNMRSTLLPAEQCALTLYDELDRPVISAIYQLNQGNSFSFYSDLIGNTAPDEVLTRIFQNDLNNASVSTILKKNYYDNYSYAAAMPFYNGYTNLAAYPVSNGVQPLVVSSRILDQVTGTSVAILDGNNTYLNSTFYYDENEQLIQSLAQNITGQVDITTSQYKWDGQLLSTDFQHSANGNVPYTNFSILTKITYDKIGRLLLTEKKLGQNPFKEVLRLIYDDLGHIQQKRLSPQYTGTNGESDIETQNYSYNIHGQLDGMNKDFALKTIGKYDKWGNANGKFFGYYFAYDKETYDGNVFDNNLLTGHIAAQLWNTLGDDEQRKYEYTYDRVGRLLTADFYQRKDRNESWNNSNINYSVRGNGGGIKYDLNGNILSLQQKGVLIGNSGVLNVDDLVYKYEPLKTTDAVVAGNRLMNVTDVGNLASINSNERLGDFKDGQPSTQDPDYVYDDNGNLLFDLNKKIQDLPNAVNNQSSINSGIRYNHLDKPEEIYLPGKGVVKILYDADGNKLRRIYESEQTGISLATTYIGEFVYTATYPNNNFSGIGDLAYINFEEGRIRIVNNISNVVVDPASSSNYLDFVTISGSEPMPGGQFGVYDYFLKDHLQNVRMVVTEQVHSGKNTCTMEANRSNDELGIFDYPNYPGVLISKDNIPPATGVVNTSPWTMAGYGNVVKLSRLGVKLGPSTLQKVMAGDEISARCYYYFNETPNNRNEQTNLANDLVSTLLNTISAGSVVPNWAKDQLNSGANISGYLTNTISSVVSPDHTEEGQGAPKAYLTMLFFDERFKFIDEASYFDRAVVAGDHSDPAVLSRIKAPKNGYVFIYVSNESDQPVYFDNFEVLNTRGRIMEENHFYPFGLKIATLSSSKVVDANEGSTANDRQFQGSYSDFDEVLGWNDFSLRTYDPQIGRWLQSDPYDQHSSPFVAMSNNPVSFADSDGGFDGQVGALTGAVIGAALAVAVALNNDASTLGVILSGAGGAFVGSGIGYATSMSLEFEGDRGGMYFGAYFRLYYKTLFGGDGVVNASYNGTLDNDGTQIYGGVRSGGGVTEDVEPSCETVPRIPTIEFPQGDKPAPQPGIRIDRLNRPPRTCMCPAITNRPVSFTFTANDGSGPDGGHSYEDPSLSDEQVNVVTILQNRLARVTRPGDIITGTLTQNMAVPGNPPNHIPVSPGSSGIQLRNPATNRRIDRFTNGQQTVPFSLAPFAGRTILSNLTSQTNSMVNAINARFRSAFVGVTNYVSAPFRYTLQVNIRRTVIGLAPCNCNSPGAR